MDRAEKKITEDNIFIFQPATKPEVLRYWLLNNSYEILAEDYVKENGKLYQIIVAKLGEPQKYTLSEMYTGTAYGNELYPEIRKHFADMFSKILCCSDEIKNPDHKVIKIMYDELKEGMKNG
jgi:tRNA (adenine22-N1)-methyltransferase